jgi:hypothetical protein
VFLDAPRLAGLQVAEDAAFLAEVGEQLVDYVHG